MLMPGKKWSEADLETLVAGYVLKMPIKKIALLVHREESAVTSKAHRLGLEWGEEKVPKDVIMVDGQIVEIYTANMNDHLENNPAYSVMTYLKDDPCDWCNVTLKEDFWGYGRWCFDSEECAKTHLKYEQENGPCHSDRTHQSHGGNVPVVGMVAPVGREPELISWAEESINKRPRQTLAKQKSIKRQTGHPSPTLSTETPSAEVKETPILLCYCAVPRPAAFASFPATEPICLRCKGRISR